MCVHRTTTIIRDIADYGIANKDFSSFNSAFLLLKPKILNKFTYNNLSILKFSKNMYQNIPKFAAHISHF